MRRVHAQSPDRLARDQPVERYPWVVRGDARGIRARAYLHAPLEHAADRRRCLGRPCAVTLHEVFALVCHAMLHGDPAAKCRDPVDVAIADRLGVIEEPVQAVEWHVFRNLLVDVQRARDGLVVGRMQAPWPAILREQAYHRLQIVLHRRRHFGTLHAEILEVGRGIHQHLARTVVTVQVVPLARAHLLHPTAEVGELRLGLLCEKVVRETHRQLIFPVKGLDDLVILGVVLESAARINDAGHAKPVDFAHEVARGVLLILRRQLRTLR